MNIKIIKNRPAGTATLVVPFFENQVDFTSLADFPTDQIQTDFLGKKGEKVIFKNYQFLVESLDKKRLKQIKVTLPHEN